MKQINIVLLMMAFFLMAFTPFKNNTALPINKDSLSQLTYIEKQKAYTHEFPFIQYNKNYIEWNNPTSISHFFKQLQQVGSKRVKILHIGDSHLQADIFTGRLRNKLQETFGYGGRGMVFPYKAAKTHAAYDYRTFCEGKWEYSRNVMQEEKPLDMGISGVTIRTYDSTASFKIVFHQGTIRSDFKTIKIYLKKCPESFQLKMKSYSTDIPIYLETDTFNSKPYVQINLPSACDTIEVFVNKTDSTQRYFECYGLLIESDEAGGILYNSVGINGAGYKSILRQSLMGSQLAELKPDLVIIDLGANDFYRKTFNTPELEDNLKKIIKTIKDASPETSIIVTNSQDIYYRKKEITSCKAFSELTRKIALENDCAFYDYYAISGGQFSMLKWLKIHFAKRDKVHLTFEGYYLKAELWYNALLNSYSEYLKAKGASSLLTETRMPIDSIPFLNKEDKTISNENTFEKKEEPSSNPVGTNTVYVVKKGDTPSSIAEKFAITVKQISKWNHLKKNKIKIGQKLNLFTNELNVNSTTKTPSPKTKATSPSKNVYSVVSGDNLSGIAKKFSTTAEALRKLNKLKDDKLHPGDKLKVK